MSMLIEPKIKVVKKEIYRVKEYVDTWGCIYGARVLAKEAGFNLSDEILIATAVSELAMNIVKYTDGGVLIIKIVKDNFYNCLGIEIVSIDSGPGIQDIGLALSESYSTELDSLGQGLPAVKRILDELKIKSSVDSGTKIKGRKWVKIDR